MTPKPQENITMSINANEQNGHVNNAFEHSKSSCDIPALVSAKGEKEPNSVSVSKTIDFDDLLPYIGEFGRYQKILFLLMIPFAFFVAFVYFSQIFITLVPDEHWCRVPELEHLSRSERFVYLFLSFF